MPTTNNLKIAFFHLAYLYSGGGEKLAIKEIQLLQQLGYTVDCYAPLVNTEECFPDLIKKINVKEIIPGFTKFFRNKPEIGVILTGILFPFFAWKYRKYDIVFAANQPSPVFGFILKILFGIPYIIYLAQPTRLIYPRAIDIKFGLKLKNKMRILPHIINIFRPIFFWLDLKSISKSDIFLCNGTYMQDILAHVYGRKPIVCPAGADLHSSIKDRYEQNVKSNQIYDFNNYKIKKPYIFLSNRHFPHKKFEYALEVLDSMQKKVDLVISGEPTEYTTELKKLVNYYKLEKYVHFLGYVTEKELESLYKNASIYLYTAPEEDFGMGVVEAMGHGIPVIAWNNAGPSKIITDLQDGYLVSFNDKKKVLEIIDNLMSNKNIYNTISQNAASKIQNQFSWQNHLDILDNSIKSTLSDKKIALVSPILEYAENITPAND
jgi:glycosyltransferase involved in cell wall biosynthesis